MIDWERPYAVLPVMSPPSMHMHVSPSGPGCSSPPGLSCAPPCRSSMCMHNTLQWNREEWPQALNLNLNQTDIHSPSYTHIVTLHGSSILLITW
uniref:Uncharacterized protein n=1 Tax=Aegilops tauschii subsp. strangulata TaxID=200361 RepID=A0A453G8T8_AEGTS